MGVTMICLLPWYTGIPKGTPLLLGCLYHCDYPSTHRVTILNYPPIRCTGPPSLPPTGLEAQRFPPVVVSSYDNIFVLYGLRNHNTDTLDVRRRPTCGPRSSIHLVAIPRRLGNIVAHSQGRLLVVVVSTSTVLVVALSWLPSSRSSVDQVDRHLGPSEPTECASASCHH